jgi:hypothetical protein
MKLSILVCSVNNRVKTFLPNVLSKLTEQSEKYDDVEIITLVDNKKIVLGDKRNMLINIASGEYVVFVDDDDDVSHDYIDTIYQSINDGTDVVTFTVNVSLNESKYKPCYYSKDFMHDYDTDDAYYRLPNHIMCIKRDLCLQTPYRPLLRGEDAEFSRELLPKINTEKTVDKVIYFYNFNQQTTETQRV